MTDLSSDSGYSLVEVLVVLVIVTIATTLVVGQMHPPAPLSALTHADLISDARPVAMRSGSPQLIEPTDGSGSVLVYPDGSLSHSADTAGDDSGQTLVVDRRSLSAMELR